MHHPSRCFVGPLVLYWGRSDTIRHHTVTQVTACLPARGCWDTSHRHHSASAPLSAQDVRSVIQRLFRGHFSYVTTCRRCGQPSEGSRRRVEFYELPLQVAGMASLEQSLVSAL